MKGDYTRFTFEKEKHYNAVRMQQGRVQMDADWNEHIDIQAYLSRTETIDVIGRCGVPKGESGFKIDVLNPAAGGRGDALTIGAGRIYVDGILCELAAVSQLNLLEAEGSVTDASLGELSVWVVAEGPKLKPQQWVRIKGGAHDGMVAQILVLEQGPATDPRIRVSFSTVSVPAASSGSLTVRALITYHTQPDYPAPPTLDAGNYLAYLDVWERHITALDDPEIREVALGGPDTATRTQTVWQMKLEPVTGDSPECEDFHDWRPDAGTALGTLAARAQPGGDDTNPCIIPPAAGYRRLENQLYRVEIHDDGSISGTPTFKWSRDNGSVVARLTDSDSTRLVVSHPRTDAVTRFATDDWLEVLDEGMVLHGEPGVFVKLGEINGNELAIAENPSGASLPTSGMVRRWEGGEPIAIDASRWQILESGVEVHFANGQFHTGDYWTIPARTITHNVEWPSDPSSGEPLYQMAQGIIHHYCPLALINYDANEDWLVLADCREEFPPLTDLPLGGCCLRVEPGDDLQQAVNQVIQGGGGCICLAKGVHVMDRPLYISEANNLTIHGESAASILHMQGVDEFGFGGIVLVKTRGISLHNFTILGADVPSLVWASSLPALGSKYQPNENLTLHDMTLVNTTASTGDTASTCALRLANADGVQVQDCRLFAEIGILSLFGDQLPFFLEIAAATVRYGKGVSRLRMTNAQIGYQAWGIWSMRSEDWNITDCDLRPFGSGGLGKIRGFLQNQPNAAQLIRHLPGYVANLYDSDGRVDSGTAIKAFHWRDSTLRNCSLYGARGMDIWWWIRGRAENNRVTAGERGIHAAWLHDTHITGNRITCNGALALSFVGSYRLCVDHNQLRASQGVSILPWAPEMFTFLDYVQEVAAIYPAFSLEGDELEGLEEYSENLSEYLAFWMLFRETLKLMGIDDDVKNIITAMFGQSQWKYLLYFMFSYQVYFYLQQYREDSEEEGEEPKECLAAIALDIHANDIVAEDVCISLEKLFMLGGADISANHLQALTGQALRINPYAMAANVQLMVGLWRAGFKWLIEEQLPEWIAEAETDPSAQGRANSLKIMLALLEDWAQQSEAFLEADYRINANTIRSMTTAVESNLWQLAVEDNHITLQEQPVSNVEGSILLDALMSNEMTHGLAVAMRDGHSVNMWHAANGMISDEVLNDAGRRSDVAEALFNVSAGVSSPRMMMLANNFAMAINTMDRARLWDAMAEFVNELGNYTNSHGILVRSPGCRLIANHVLVPADADPGTWARGGIAVVTTDAEDEPSGGMGGVELLVLLQLVGVNAALDPVVGMRETVIADNEIVGGFGYGVHVKAPTDLGFGRLGLLDIQISSNEIRGMGGAGIVIDEETFAMGLDIEANRISECSSNTSIGRFSSISGGIVIANAGFSRLHENRIHRCGTTVSNNYAFGVHVDTVYGLSLSNNHLLCNGSPASPYGGGVYLRNVYGDVSLHDNDLHSDIGYELYIQNDSDINDIPNGLFNLINWYAKQSLEYPVVDPEQLYSALSVQDNQIQSIYISGLLIIDVDEINFTGNHIKMVGYGAAIYEVNRALIANNIVRGAQGLSIIVHANSATVIGNMTSARMFVSTATGQDFRIDLNLPDVIHQII